MQPTDQQTEFGKAITNFSQELLNRVHKIRETILEDGLKSAYLGTDDYHKTRMTKMAVLKEIEGIIVDNFRTLFLSGPIPGARDLLKKSDEEVEEEKKIEEKKNKARKGHVSESKTY